MKGSTPPGFFVHKMNALILLTDKSEGYPGWGGGVRFPALQILTLDLISDQYLYGK